LGFLFCLSMYISPFLRIFTLCLTWKFPASLRLTFSVWAPSLGPYSLLLPYFFFFSPNYPIAGGGNVFSLFLLCMQLCYSVACCDVMAKKKEMPTFPLCYRWENHEPFQITRFEFPFAVTLPPHLHMPSLNAYLCVRWSHPKGGGFCRWCVFVGIGHCG